MRKYIIIAMAGIILFVSCGKSGRQTIVYEQENEVVYEKTADRFFCVDGPLRVRTGPGLTYETTGKLETGEWAEITEKSGRRDEIEGQTDFWYRIHFNDIQGYVFGGYGIVIEGETGINHVDDFADKLPARNINYMPDGRMLFRSSNGQMKVRLMYAVKLLNTDYYCRIAVEYRPKPSVEADVLMNKYDLELIDGANAQLGIGDAYKILAGLPEYVIEEGVRHLENRYEPEGKFFLAEWGSGQSKDIMAVLFEKDINSDFDAVFIAVFDAYTGSGQDYLNTGFITSNRDRLVPEMMIYQLFYEYFCNVKIDIADPPVRPYALSQTGGPRDIGGYVYSPVADADADADAYAVRVAKDGAELRTVPYRKTAYGDETHTLQDFDLRIPPNAEDFESEVIKTLSAGDRVAIQNRSNNKYAVDNLPPDYWYKILTENGESGYVFGGYLKETDERRYDAVTAAIEKAVAELSGYGVYSAFDGSRNHLSLGSNNQESLIAESFEEIKSWPLEMRLRICRITLFDIKKVPDLSSLPSISNVFIKSEMLEDISSLAGLGIEIIEILNGAPVSDVSALSTNANLYTISLYNTKITKIPDLSRLKNLKWLDVGSTPIRSLQGVETAVSTGLKVLVDRCNLLEDLDPLLYSRIEQLGIDKENRKRLKLWFDNHLPELESRGFSAGSILRPYE